jgi:type IV pilus assembly protein PilA
MGKSRNQPGRGFTLIELMLVVTLLAIIMAIAIPSMLQARKHANEGAAIASLRSVSTAQERYRIRFGSYAALTDLVASSCVDSSFASGQKSGYTFATSVATVFTWSMTASPTTVSVTGDRYFLVDDSGVIRFSEAGVPTSADNPID